MTGCPIRELTGLARWGGVSEFGGKLLRNLAMPVTGQMSVVLEVVGQPEALTKIYQGNVVLSGNSGNDASGMMLVTGED